MNTDSATRSVSGPMTFVSVPALFAGSSGWFAAGRDITIDLAQVTQADSAGLALLVEWLRQARRAQCRARFINIPPQMQVLIRVNCLQGTLISDKAA
jgi:phospholipid transport system transporter-binding protein